MGYSIMVHSILRGIITPISYNPRPDNMVQGLLDILNRRKPARIGARPAITTIGPGHSLFALLVIDRLAGV